MVTLTPKTNFQISISGKEYSFEKGKAIELSRQEAFEVFQKLNTACLDEEGFFETTVI